MKNIFVILLLTTLTSSLYAQRKTIGVTTGLSAFNSKSVALSYEVRLKNRNCLGIFAETYFYADQKIPLSLQSGETHYYVGLYYKPLLHSSRNFSNHLVLGAAAGTYSKKFLYYAFAGLEQDFYISPKSILFVGEEVKYLFPLKNNWQPFIKIGMKLTIL